MRILIVPSWYPTPRNPVNGIFIREQADALRDRHSICVIYLYLLPRNHKGKPVRRSSNARGYSEEFIEVPSVPFLWRFNYLWCLIRAYLRAKRRFVPQIIHAHVALPAGWAAVLLGRLFSVPVLITENSSTFAPWLARPSWKIMAQQAFAGADVVVAVSEGLKLRIIETFHRKGPTLVIPNIVNTEHFNVTPFPEVEGGYRLLFVGLMDTEQKGVPILIDALAKLRDVKDLMLHVDLVGDGILRASYQEQSEELGLAEIVTFHGLQSHATIAKMLQTSHALVLPSLHEALPLVIIEALASGRPVISTRCGGPEYMLDSTNGLIVEVGQPAPLADAIIDLMTHLKRYDPQAIADAAIRQYSYHAVTDKLGILYAQMIQQAARNKKRRKR